MVELTRTERLQLFLRATHDVSSVGFWEFDFDTNTYAWSDQIAEMLHFPDGFVITSDNFMERVHPEDRDAVERAIQLLREDAVPYDATFRFMDFTGTYRMIREEGRAVRKADGKVTRIIGSLTDLTDRYHRFGHFDDSLSLIEDIASNLPGAIMRYVHYPEQSDRVEYVSEGCEDIWEVPQSDIVGPVEEAEALLNVDDPYALQASINDAVATMTPWRHEWCMTTKSGRTKTLCGRGHPHRALGGAVMFNSVILDITSEVTARQEAARSSELLMEHRRLESVGRMASGVAHDFNNLLTIIKGNSELLQLSALDDDTRQMSQDIFEAAMRGEDMTRGLLKFARRSQMESAVLDVDRVIDDIEPLLRRAIPARVRYHREKGDHLGTCRVNKTFLESALMNLTINACDAMPSGGDVVIRTSSVVVAECCAKLSLPSGRYVRIEVEDSGDGIASELLPHVFDPFVTSKSADNGTGLGLAMVDGFARNAGGGVDIHSREGIGTRLDLYLPAH